MEGRVIKSTGSWYDIQDGEGKIWQSRLRGKIRLDNIRSTNPVAVGDIVDFEQEKDKETAVIKGIKPRNNAIIRQSVNLSKATHVIAANIDQAIIVATISNPRTSTGFIDRFLVTAEAYHIPSTLIFNKIDIYTDEEKEYMNQLIDYYQSIGYTSFAVSAKTGCNIDLLRETMKGKTNLFSGHSGVGKSALVNALDHSMNLRVGAISDVHSKGKHTTTHAEIFTLNFGAWIIDSPGIKEFGLYDLDKETLAQRFPEMRNLMSECRFNNCTHTHEPGCAIKKVLEEGLIAQWRYTNYTNMMNGEIATGEDY